MKCSNFLCRQHNPGRGKSNNMLNTKCSDVEFWVNVENCEARKRYNRIMKDIKQYGYIEAGRKLCQERDKYYGRQK